MMATPELALSVRPEAKVTALDPHALLSRALETGASVETVERLVALAERMQAIQARTAWEDAMSEFHKRVPKILKDETAQIRTRSGAAFDYKYATLDGILDTVRPLLGELGLSARWKHATTDTHAKATCLVAHTLGHVEESGEVTIPIEQQVDGGSGASPAQRVGIAMTYARRYSLLAVLGLAPEDDKDGQSQHTPRPPGEGTGPRGIVGEPVAKPARTDGSVVITDVVEQSGNSKKGAWTRWQITFDDGRTMSTFNKSLAGAAETAKQDGSLVIPITEQKGAYTNLVSLTPAELVVGPVGEALDSFAAEIDAAALDEAKERGALMAEVKRLADKIGLATKDRHSSWATYLGEATPADAPLEGLNDLLAWLRTRAGE
jgi:hypothetical protein